MRTRIALALTLAFTLACGGGPAAPKYGSPAFQKYKYDTSTLQFNNDTKVTTWWRNMACDTIEGTWTQDGEEIHLTFTDPNDCMGYDELKMRQTGECSMVTYWMKNTNNGEVKDDDPWNWERTEPKCR